MWAAAEPSSGHSPPMTFRPTPPCAPMLAPSSSLPPSITTSPDVPTTHKKRRRNFGFIGKQEKRYTRSSRHLGPDPTAIKSHVEETFNRKCHTNSTELFRMRQPSWKNPSCMSGNRSGKKASQDRAHDIRPILGGFVTRITVSTKSDENQMLYEISKGTESSRISSSTCVM
jgi:hypothetical protein